MTGALEELLPTERVAPDGGQRDVPEDLGFGALEHHEVPTLRLAGTRCSRREVDETFEIGGVDRCGGERPGHPPMSNDLGELGHDGAVSGDRV